MEDERIEDKIGRYDKGERMERGKKEREKCERKVAFYSCSGIMQQRSDHTHVQKHTVG